MDHNLGAIPVEILRGWEAKMKICGEGSATKMKCEEGLPLKIKYVGRGSCKIYAVGEGVAFTGYPWGGQPGVS